MKHTLLLLFCLDLIVGISFFPSLQNQFTSWDDQKHLTENLSVQRLNPEGLRNIFESTVLKTYIPLTIVSFAIEYHFVRFNPFVYHLDNLFLHLLITNLIFILALKMNLPARASFLAALLFGIHPMHVESVAWVTERKDVLYSTFYLLALIFYWEYLEQKRWRFYFVALLMGLLSMLAKAMALTLPFVLILFDWFTYRRDWRRILLEKVPFLLYIVPLALKTFLLNADLYQTTAYILRSVMIYLWTATFYLQKFIFLGDFSPVYELPVPVNFSNFQYWIVLFILAASAFILVRFRRNRWVVFAFSFYLLSIFFLFRSSYVAIQGFVADRFMYLPSVGFCFLFGFCINQALERISKKKRELKIATYGVLVALFLFLSTKTFFQCQIWYDSRTLWTYIIKRVTYLAFPYNNRGNVYLDEGKYDLAAKDYLKSLERDPRYPEPYNNLGIIFTRTARYDDAKKSFDTAIALAPNYIEAYFNRGTLFMNQGQWELAMKDFDQALNLDPKLFQANNNRGVIYLSQRKYDRALIEFTKAVETNPLYKEGYVNRAETFQLLGEADKRASDLRMIERLSKQ